jgi:hypothetical protein
MDTLKKSLYFTVKLKDLKTRIKKLSTHWTKMPDEYNLLGNIKKLDQ